MLLALSLHADWSPKGFGRCFPRRDTLALETRLQVSHVSEAVQKLANEHHLLTIVRLGRKNVYYVREIGANFPMPPSDPEPFFEFLGRLGIHLEMKVFPRPSVSYLENSRKFEDYSGLYARIFSDYFNGLTPAKLDHAIKLNAATPTGSLVDAIIAGGSLS